MPARCPNCWFQVTQQAPHVGRIYRCPVCKQDLSFDAQKEKFVAARRIEPDTPKDKSAYKAAGALPEPRSNETFDSIRLADR